MCAEMEKMRSALSLMLVILSTWPTLYVDHFLPELSIDTHLRRKEFCINFDEREKSGLHNDIPNVLTNIS